MLAKSIIESDMFSDMPTEAQMLYVRLNMAADDDGFIDNPRAIMRAYGFSDDNMKILISKKFVLTFQKGDNFIYLIKHWKVNNYIRNDRYHESKYKQMLRDVYYDENNAYSLTPEGNQPCLGIPSGNQVVDNRYTEYGETEYGETEVRLGKDSIGKFSLDKDSTGKGVQGENPEPTISDTQEFSTENNNSVISSYPSQEKIDYWIARCNKAQSLNPNMVPGYINFAKINDGVIIEQKDGEFICLNLQSSP